MDCKEGTLESLVQAGVFNSPQRISHAKTLVHHMLQALDYLDNKKILHRDVKPANILYSTCGDSFHFQLGDFGVGNYQDNAVTRSGTDVYMAPEVDERRGPQTHKVDVYSLFVTMLWTLDVGGFRSETNITKNQELVTRLSSHEDISDIQEMAEIIPARRASAAQMLVKYFDGIGLTTPRNRVPPLCTPATSSTPPLPEQSITRARPEPRIRRPAPRAPDRNGASSRSGLAPINSGHPYYRPNRTPRRQARLRGVDQGRVSKDLGQ